jgi:hypothetical protein
VANRRIVPARSEPWRRKLSDLRANGPWSHDVVDLGRKRVSSEEHAGQLTAAARTARLSALGPLFDGSIFGGPTYRLSSRKPYQEAPLAWLSASSPVSYLTETEEIAWAQARNPGSDRGFMQFHFDEPPPGKCIASVSISTFPWSGATGGVTLRSGSSSVTIPVTKPVNRFVEVIFEPPAGGPADVVMIVEPGIQVLAFFFMTLGPAPLVLTL